MLPRVRARGLGCWDGGSKNRGIKTAAGAVISYVPKKLQTRGSHIQPRSLHVPGNLLLLLLLLLHFYLFVFSS